MIVPRTPPEELPPAGGVVSVGVGVGVGVVGVELGGRRGARGRRGGVPGLRGVRRGRVAARAGGLPGLPGARRWTRCRWPPQRRACREPSCAAMSRGLGVFTAGVPAAADGAGAIPELTGGAGWCRVLAASMAPPPNTANTATSTPAAGMNKAGPRDAASGSSGTGNPARLNGSARRATSWQYSTASEASSDVRPSTWYAGQRAAPRRAARQQRGRVHMAAALFPAHGAGARDAGGPAGAPRWSAHRPTRPGSRPVPGRTPSRDRAPRAR